MPGGAGALNGAIVLVAWPLYSKANFMWWAVGGAMLQLRSQRIVWRGAVIVVLAVAALGVGAAGAARGADEAAEIRKVLTDQQEAWNRGDVDAFLVGYWKSEQTAFAGAQGIVRGWDGLRERYRKGYPDRRAMGTLTFSELEITPLCADAALVLGHWHLEREAGPVGGVFSLVLRKLPEGWRIVADHTSQVDVRK